MREIKFRAWDKEDKEMLYCGDTNKYGQGFLLNLNGDLIEDNDKGNFLHSLTWARIAHSMNLMQYTGLKDKNGKEIYEGDVLKTETGRNKSVEWFENGFYLEGVSHSQIDCEESEVIGNIYENPELLSPERKQTEVKE